MPLPCGSPTRAGSHGTSSRRFLWKYPPLPARLRYYYTVHVAAPESCGIRLVFCPAEITSTGHAYMGAWPPLASGDKKKNHLILSLTIVTQNTIPILRLGSATDKGFNIYFFYLLQQQDPKRELFLQISLQERGHSDLGYNSQDT